MNDPLRIPFSACPLCDSQTLVQEATADCSRHPLYKQPLSPVMNWNHCTACGHVFTEGYFTPEGAALVFSSTNTSQKLGQDLERQRMLAARMVEKVLPYVSDGTWLDVGFGNGALLFTAQEYGFTPVGADLRTENVTQLKALGISAILKNSNWKRPAPSSA